MTTARQRKRKIVEAPPKHSASSGATGAKKSTNKSSGHHQKAKGVLPSINAQVSSQQLANHPETIKEVLAVGLRTRQFDASLKIKLQLFPIDEVTRIRLEKDGHNPFLELTLRARKKVSSVLKHISTKWGSSSITLGEPMLFPYNIPLENLSTGIRWTLNDTSISAGDVYEAIGTPAIFRLSYGWFTNIELKNYRVPSTYTPLEVSLGFEGIQKGCSTTSKLTHDQLKKFEIKSKEVEKLVNNSKAADAVVTEKMPLDVPVDRVDEVKTEIGFAQSEARWDDCVTSLSMGGLFSEASLQGKINNIESTSKKAPEEPLSCSWDDSFTSLSIGGLISEASLLGKISNCDSKSNASKSGLPLISDSIDAFIAQQYNSHPHASKPSSHDTHSSILDAEETCHAFSFRKVSAPDKDVALSGRAISGSCSRDSSSNSFKFPRFLELNKQAGIAPDPPRQESNTELLPCSRVFNEDNSLGLTGIKWNNDSLEPFDLGISTFRQVSNGDSLGITRFVQ